ncbi:MAG: glycosyltransferase family 4 protein [Candidatus Bathyarchaeia archaeon]
MGRLKILQFVPNFLPFLGGTEINTYMFAKHSRHKHFVLTDQLPNTPQYENLDGITVYRIGPMKKNYRIRLRVYLTEVARELNKLIKYYNMDFDVMHLHGCTNFPSLLVDLDGILGHTVFKKLMVWRLCKKPIILTLHSTPSHDFPWREPFLKKPFPTPKFRKSWIGLESYFRTKAEVIVCVDRYMAALMNSFPGKAKVIHIPSGTDTELFKPMEKKKAIQLLPNSIKGKLENCASNFLVLYVGRLHFEKGAHFLESFAKKLPSNIKLIVAGHGDLRLLGNSKKMIYIESVKNEDLPALINSCDAVFNPVLFVGISRVTLEAMACGKPVVMFGGVDRYPLTHRKNGFAVSNIDEAVETIVHLKNDNELYSRISSEGLKTARENSVQELAKVVDTLYEEVASSKS